MAGTFAEAGRKMAEEAVMRELVSAVHAIQTAFSAGASGDGMSTSKSAPATLG